MQLHALEWLMHVFLISRAYRTAPHPPLPQISCYLPAGRLGFRASAFGFPPLRAASAFVPQLSAPRISDFRLSTSAPAGGLGFRAAAFSPSNFVLPPSCFRPCGRLRTSAPAGGLGFRAAAFSPSDFVLPPSCFRPCGRPRTSAPAGGLGFPRRSFPPLGFRTSAFVLPPLQAASYFRPCGRPRLSAPRHPTNRPPCRRP